ncbi:hypothetical protein ABS71_14515 [bacterium SCN 62-11]|nr:hypothetical protein [Candidatus Eremiobacteraeota bacterium]ODT63286.1 MAG: hypothetical protein ABS71_14515 [bacterium SCN 62-11]
MYFLRFVGIVLMVAAAPKLRHPDSFLTALHGYRLFPEWSMTLLQYGVPVLEVGLGVALILFLWRPAVAASALLFAGFTLVLSAAWWRGLTLTCGCFGRIDRHLHNLPHGLVIHILLNALVTLGLIWSLRPKKRPVRVVSDSAQG